MLEYLASLDTPHWLYFLGVLFPWLGAAAFFFAMIRVGTEGDYPQAPAKTHLYAVPDVD